MEGQAGGERSLVLAGRHPVLEALRSGTRPIDEVLIEGETAGTRHRDILALARQAGVRCGRAPRAALTTLAGTRHHQGVVARVAARAYDSLDHLLAIPAARGEPALFLALDQVQDPGNVGSLLRTAETLGVHGVVLLRHQAAGLTAGAARSAAGALEHLAVARVGNLAAFLHDARGPDRWVAGTDADDGEDYREAGLGPDTILVLGAEGAGLRPRVRSMCDRIVRIPMHGRVDSLNVSVAAAVLLFDIARLR